MRERFPLWSRVAFAILLPIAAYTAWDYVEMRRLGSRLSAIRQKGEPTTPQYQRPTGPAADAERYYRAASALAFPVFADLSVDVRTPTWKALRESRWTQEAIEIFRAAIARNREALGFVDRADTLPFRGFMAGTSYNYRVADLMNLATLCEVRAAVSASEGDGDAAVASFASEARIVRALDFASLPLGSLVPTFTGLSVAMEKTRPPTAARDVAARAFADIDRDDRLRDSLLRYRATLLSDPPPWLRGSPRWPLSTHALVRALDEFDRLLIAASQPWPQRIEATNAVGAWPPWPGVVIRGGPRQILNEFTRVTAGQVRRIRCARLIVSPTPLDLVDPFSGKRLEASQCRL